MLHREYLQAGESLSSWSGSYIVKMSEAEAAIAALYQRLQELEYELQLSGGRDTTKTAEIESKIKQIKIELEQQQI